MYCRSTECRRVVADCASGFVTGLTRAFCVRRVGRGCCRGVMSGLLSVAGVMLFLATIGTGEALALVCPDSVNPASANRIFRLQISDPSASGQLGSCIASPRNGAIKRMYDQTFTNSDMIRIFVPFGNSFTSADFGNRIKIVHHNSGGRHFNVSCTGSTVTNSGNYITYVSLPNVGDTCNLVIRTDRQTPPLMYEGTLTREANGYQLTRGSTEGGFKQVASSYKTQTLFDPQPIIIHNAFAGQPVTVTATVTNITDATTPTGTVTFKDGNGNIACTNAGDGTLRERRAGVAFATCTFTTPGTPGPIVLDVEYAKTGDFQASKASEKSGANPAQTRAERTLKVQATATATFVTDDTGATEDPGVIRASLNQEITLYVKVVSDVKPPLSLNGKVELQDHTGAKIPNSSCGSLNNGVATCTIPGAFVTRKLPDFIYAGYKGDTIHNDITASRPWRAIRVSSSKTGLAKPTIVLTPSNPQAGDKITATITFTKPQGQSANFNGVPKITISGIRIDNDMCASVTAVPANGVITCTFDVPVAGNGEVGVAYSGDPTYADTQAGPAPFTVISRTGKLPAPAPVISLDKTNPDINGEVTVTVTFASPPKPGTGYSGTVKVTVTGTGNPSAAIGKNTCGRDITIPTTGGPVTCRFTPTSIGEFEVSIAPADLNDKAYNFGAVKPVKGRAGPKVADLTAQMIRDFLGDRNAMLLASTPDIHMRLRDREQSGAGGHISVNLGKSEDGTASALSMELRTPLPGDVSITDDTITFAASARRLMGSGLLGADVSDDVADPIIYTDVSKSADPVQRWDVWVEGRIARFDSDNGKDGKFGVVYLGADYLITPNVLIGLMTQYDWLSKDYRAANGQITGHVKGKGWMVGPYAAVRFGEKLYLDVQARGGQSSNDITPIGTYTDTFKTTRWFVRGKLIGDFDYGDWTIRPGVAVQYISEKQKAYTDSLGNAIAAQTVSQGDVRVGPRIAYTYNLAGGSALIPWAEFAGVYTFGSKGKFSNGTYASDIHGFSGSVKAGVDWWTPGGARFSLAGSYDGIGSGSASYGVQARVEITF